MSKPIVWTPIRVKFITLLQERPWNPDDLIRELYMPAGFMIRSFRNVNPEMEFTKLVRLFRELDLIELVRRERIYIQLTFRGRIELDNSVPSL